MIDTHSHIYSEEFDADFDAAIERAKAAGVETIILPNVDMQSIERLHNAENRCKNYCFAAIGLHPTSVDADYKNSLAVMRRHLEQRPYIAIGEAGIDFYWDKTFAGEQILAFEQQIAWAQEFDLPLIIHSRNAQNEVIRSLKKFKNLRGIFHSFSGSFEQAQEILRLGDFKLGINGVVTFKNANLPQTLSRLSLNDLVLETDAPYLTPAPYRGKRNESAYVKFVAEKLANVYQVPMSEVDKITTENTTEIFKTLKKC
ncbi:MAG: TatD family hydrolase [Prevotellaceae bacterium]|jgi:TatD DNase family protein|nr:TatD family hydrolase [Prevotellaceae bacterium]